MTLLSLMKEWERLASMAIVPQVYDACIRNRLRAAEELLEVRAAYHKNKMQAKDGP